MIISSQQCGRKLGSLSLETWQPGLAQQREAGGLGAVCWLGRFKGGQTEELGAKGGGEEKGGMERGGQRLLGREDRKCSGQEGSPGEASADLQHKPGGFFLSHSLSHYRLSLKQTSYTQVLPKGQTEGCQACGLLCIYNMSTTRHFTGEDPLASTWWRARSRAPVCVRTPWAFLSLGFRN